MYADLMKFVQFKNERERERQWKLIQNSVRSGVYKRMELVQSNGNCIRALLEVERRETKRTGRTNLSGNTLFFFLKFSL